MDETYTATKTRSGRPGWSVSFRHPLRRDARGKVGLKVRRGLDTTDDSRADDLVAELNTLLSDRRWWSADRRADAEREFDLRVVSAFFDGIEVGRLDAAALRESKIPLPGREQGYARVLLAGATGAAKTTLLRHLIGSNHKADRFPSTSTARTTIADTEVVTADGPFEAVVTFMSEFEVRAHVDECIEAACLAAIESQSEERIAGALLMHREQRFRLPYILGEWTQQEPSADEESAFEFEAPGDIEDQTGVTAGDRAANAARLRGYVERIKALAAAVADETAKDFGTLLTQATPDDTAAWLELYSDRLFESEEFAKLALDIKDDIESRFDLLAPDILERSATGWPQLASFSSDDRAMFLDQVRWFSSNHSAQFGRLLTPLVDGIRVRGPFRPLKPELQIADRLVLIDGEGLGHTAESASSVSTKITRRFADIDLILLVDSAQQPMQAAPIALLQSASAAGCGDKIAVAFSHFDQVKGDNLRTIAQKRSHVLASVGNAIASLRQRLGASVAAALERRLDDRTFLFGALDRELDAIPSGVIGEMVRLLTLFRAASAPEKRVEATPIYATGGLELALRDAVESFLRPWEARLGIVARDGVRTEHWTRVKALTRRFANSWGDEYDTLRPASDLIGCIQEEISRWLDCPAGWTRKPSDDDELVAALNPVRNAVFSALHALVTERLGEQHRAEWMSAYAFSGRGSGLRRVGEIRRIYEESAPPISASMQPAARAFLTEVVRIVREAVEKSGGRFDMAQAA